MTVDPDDPIESYDLEGPAPHLFEVHGSSDPNSLDYWGPLNVLGVRANARRACSLHPEDVIGEDGCPRCRAIHNHRRGRTDDGS